MSQKNKTPENGADKPVVVKKRAGTNIFIGNMPIEDLAGLSRKDIDYVMKGETPNEKHHKTNIYMTPDMMEEFPSTLSDSEVDLDEDAEEVDEENSEEEISENEVVVKENPRKPNDTILEIDVPAGVAEFNVGQMVKARKQSVAKEKKKKGDKPGKKTGMQNLLNAVKKPSNENGE